MRLKIRYKLKCVGLLTSYVLFITYLSELIRRLDNGVRVYLISVYLFFVAPHQTRTRNDVREQVVRFRDAT